MSIIWWRKTLHSTSYAFNKPISIGKMILKLLFLSQISNARELESDVPDARLDARDDPKYYKKIAYEEIELTEDDLV